MVQLQLSEQQFNYLLKCVIYYRLDGKSESDLECNLVLQSGSLEGHVEDHMRRAYLTINTEVVDLLFNVLTRYYKTV